RSNATPESPPVTFRFPGCCCARRLNSNLGGRNLLAVAVRKRRGLRLRMISNLWPPAHPRLGGRFFWGRKRAGSAANPALAREGRLRVQDGESTRRKSVWADACCYWAMRASPGPCTRPCQLKFLLPFGLGPRERRGFCFHLTPPSEASTAGSF